MGILVAGGGVSPSGIWPISCGFYCLQQSHLLDKEMVLLWWSLWLLWDPVMVLCHFDHAFSAHVLAPRHGGCSWSVADLAGWIECCGTCVLAWIGAAAGPWDLHLTESVYIYLYFIFSKCYNICVLKESVYVQHPIFIIQYVSFSWIDVPRAPEEATLLWNV